MPGLEDWSTVPQGVKKAYNFPELSQSPVDEKNMTMEITDLVLETIMGL